MAKAIVGRRHGRCANLHPLDSIERVQIGATGHVTVDRLSRTNGAKTFFGIVTALNNSKYTREPLGHRWIGLGLQFDRRRFFYPPLGED